MITALKIGALICLPVGLIIASFLANHIFPLREYVVVQKVIERNGGWTGYRLFSKEPDMYGKLDGLGLNQTYSKSFYDTAIPGDYLRSSIFYSQLVRNEQVIKRDVSSDFLFFTALGLLAFFPLILFIRWKNKVVRVLAGLFSGVAEMLSVSLFLYVFYFEY